MNKTSIKQYYAEDHDRLDGLFGDFERLKKADSARAKESLDAFIAGLKRHMAWEEEILFPAFEEKTGMHGAGPTEVMRLEHREIKRFLEIIVQNFQEEPSTGAEEQAMIELLKAHNLKEESILYPSIDSHLNDEERRAVFLKMQSR